MTEFLTLLRWELKRLCLRPRTWLPFGICLCVEFSVSLLLKLPEVRATIARDIWKMRTNWTEVFSGLTTATHLLGETFTVGGVLGLALVAAGSVAGEREQGVLRMVFSRPVSRSRLFAVKCLTCLLYTTLLVLFIGASTLATGLVFEGAGPLLMLAPHEGVMGSFSFASGLQRYGLAVALLWFSAVSGMLSFLFISTLPMKPAAAIVLALALYTTDNLLRTAPETVIARPYCVTTRLLSWRQVFNDEIPWARIRRNYRELALLDAAFLVAAWYAFRRADWR
ncbi:MAG: ABC transporter permease subunit [Verrucomicrobiae bacterium]|nr:ABC transporter permease subunit [Verrucomicrobiae bacterium]